MLSLTRKADYALVALVYLGHQWSRQAGPISARQVADLLDLPGPLLMNTLKELTQAGLLRSTRGTAGGYELAQDPARISLRQVIAAVEQDPADRDEHTEGEPAPPAVLRRLHEQIDGFLDRLSLGDLLQEAGEELASVASVTGHVPVRSVTTGRSQPGAER